MDMIYRMLAVYGLVIAFTSKDGFLDVFKKTREAIIGITPEEHKGSIATGLTCPTCASFWIAPIVFLMPIGLVRLLSLIGFVVTVEQVKPFVWDAGAE